jgi:hypothetical protein
MVELLDEIEFLNSVLIAMQEGASDEKRMAMQAIENRIAKKQKIISDFEKEAFKILESEYKEVA